MSIFATLVGISIIMLTIQFAFLKILPSVRFYTIFCLLSWSIFLFGTGGNLYIMAEERGYFASIFIFILIFVLVAGAYILTVFHYHKILQSRDEVQEMMKDLMSSRYGKKD